MKSAWTLCAILVLAVALPAQTGSASGTGEQKESATKTSAAAQPSRSEIAMARVEEGNDGVSTSVRPAAPANSSGSGSAEKSANPGANSAAAVPSAPARPEPVEDQIQQLRDLVNAQSQELAATREQMKQQQQKVLDLEQRLKASDAHGNAADTVSAGSSVSVSHDAPTAISAAPAAVALAASGAAAPVSANAQSTQEHHHEDSPMAIHFKGITITPGGFLAAETTWRSRALGADVNTPFNSITMPGASQSSMSEFFGSGRQSRISMLAEGKLSMAKLSGYYEADFLSSAATSNNNQSNSYSLRQRQVWGQAALDTGWTFTAGQQWSLITETKHGVDNRTEALPMTIDANYHVGFTWARQYGFRVAKNFNNKFWIAASLENAQATLSTHGNAPNFLIGSAGNSGGLYNSTISNCSTSVNSTTGAVTTTCSPVSSYAFNPSPDIVVKLVAEPGFGHYEIFGVYSRFRDRIFPCEDISSTATCGTSTTPGPNASGAFNSSKDGGGFGANARWSFFNKHVDFGLHGFGGSGIGRYGSGGLPDTSIRANGSFDLVRVYQGLSTLEWHGPKLDIYLNAGAEYASRAATFDPVSGKNVGYGAPTFSNSGCYTESAPQNGAGFLPGSLGSCTADTRVLVEGTAGFWHKIYNGDRGRLQWGPQFSYVVRNTWSGASGFEPHGLDAMVFTSFRYYLP